MVNLYVSESINLLHSVHVIGYECLLVALFDKARPIFKRVPHAAAVDEVEFLVILPVFFNVVDFEADIWRDPGIPSN